MPLDPATYHFTNDDAEAASRADDWRDTDPFENSIPPALLSQNHIKEYVRVTGMLCPFFPENEERLKAASYEAWPKRFIRWDENGKKIIDDVSREEYARHGYELKENSITFVQIDTTIRLPNYIALRFNLSITHVHRGLLLGTGPLVDPGFSGDLLIPLHNLTSAPYRLERGIIWFEFTKTSSIYDPPADFKKRKRNVDSETYFERASRNNPIQSSIPIEVKKAHELATQAETDARRATRLVQIFVGIGLVAVIATAIGLLAYIESARQSIITLAASPGAQAIADFKKAQEDLRDLKALVENGEARRSREEIQRINQQLDELKAQIESLRRETRP